MMPKTLLVNLAALGNMPTKIEGIALVPAASAEGGGRPSSGYHNLLRRWADL